MLLIFSVTFLLSVSGRTQTNEHLTSFWLSLDTNLAAWFGPYGIISQNWPLHQPESHQSSLKTMWGFSCVRNDFSNGHNFFITCNSKINMADVCSNNEYSILNGYYPCKKPMAIIHAKSTNYKKRPTWIVCIWRGISVQVMIRILTLYVVPISFAIILIIGLVGNTLVIFVVSILIGFTT